MRRRIARSSLVVFVGNLLLSGCLVSAQEAPPAPEPVDIPKLVQQLDSDKFNERQAASAKLAEAGVDALPALAEAAKSPSREANSRSIDILRKHLESKDEKLKKGARETLESLAKSDVPRVASGAAEALKPKPDPNQPLNGAIVPGAVIRAPIQLQMQAVAGGMNRRTSIQNVNGVKTTTIEENGRKVRIVDDPAKGIEMEVTEKVDGKDQTKKYEAKDAEELKKKHPDAHKIYEESSKPQGIQIQIGNAIPGFPALPRPIRGLPNAIPVPVPGIPELPVTPAIPNAARDKAIREPLEKAQRELKDAEERLKKAAAGTPQADEVAKSVQQLEAARKQLEEALEKLKTP